jgi:4-amino-4-deoxychorismate lyase
MTQSPLTLVNSQLQTQISVLDRGLAYGDGIFETMKVQNGEICLWQYHYERLIQGLQRLDIDLNANELLAHLKATLTHIKSDSGVLKLVITRGEGSRGYGPSGTETATLVSQFSQIDNAFEVRNQQYQQQGVHVHCCETVLAINPLIAGIKSLNQLSYVLASKERQALDLEEGLLFSSDGHLIEATARNIFLVKDGALYTPCLEHCGVAGVMRRLIIERISLTCPLSVNEIAISKKELYAADEVFLSNSISHIWPVIQCSEQVWPRGAITESLQAGVDAFLEKDNTLSFSTFLSQQSLELT